MSLSVNSFHSSFLFPLCIIRFFSDKADDEEHEGQAVDMAFWNFSEVNMSISRFYFAWL